MTGSGEGLSLRFMLVSAKPAPLEAFSAHDLLLCSTSTRMKASTHHTTDIQKGQERRALEPAS